MQEEFWYEQLKIAMSESYPGIKYQPFLQANYVRLSPNECDGLINDATKILKEQNANDDFIESLVTRLIHEACVLKMPN